MYKFASCVGFVNLTLGTPVVLITPTPIVALLFKPLPRFVQDIPTSPPLFE